MSDGPNTDRDFDVLLDSALSMYGDPGPDSGLEDSVLSRIASVTVAQSTSRRWVSWALSISAAASLLFALVLSGVKTMHSPAGQGTSLQVSSVPPQPSQVTEHSSKPPQSSDFWRVPSMSTQGGGPAARAAFRSAKLRSPLPKLDVFPAPQPLSPEEEVLARFATQAAPAERALFLDAQRQPDTPLHIATINIPPLDSPVKGDN
jgi:hypothetical protein